MATRSSDAVLVPVRDARRLLLAGCALDRAPARSTKARVLDLVRTLGFVQVDSISSVERAHHLILHARLDGYGPAHLSHHTEVSRHAFEHWTHDASVIRSDWLPWWTHRFERSRARLRQSAWMRERLGRGWRGTLAEVREALEARGPLATRDFQRPARAGPSEGWWDWSPHKAALEFLWRTGEVAIHSRRGFEKIYDLAERVHGALPQVPPREEMVAWACHAALERLGAATAREIAHFAWAITPAEAGAWCAKAAQRGEIAAVSLERLGRSARPGFARLDWKRAAARARLDDTPRLLAPFDPLIRERVRLAELFGFHYRFEAFVPAAKRVHGYYTMPVLAGERLVSRLDLASDRDAGMLRVDRVWHEPGAGARVAGATARRAAERLAGQLGLGLAWPRASAGAVGARTSSRVPGNAGSGRSKCVEVRLESAGERVGQAATAVGCLQLPPLGVSEASPTREATSGRPQGPHCAKSGLSLEDHAAWCGVRMAPRVGPIRHRMIAASRETSRMRTPLLDSSVRCMSMIATLSLASGASANLLANPGYESTAFTASSNVMANFAAYQGAWGILAGGITPATAGVTPADGAQMLCMVGAGQLITNTVQVVDVSSAAALIGTGSAVVNASALYNTNGGYSGAVGRLRARFYSGPSQSSLLGSSTLASFTLDSDPATWEQASIAASIPVGTSWILYEVSYTGASLAGNTGFVDQSSMTIGAVPAPGALALLALAGVVGRRSR